MLHSHLYLPLICLPIKDFAIGSFNNERSDKTKSRLVRPRFSQRTNKINLFCLLFCFSRETKQICLFVFWEYLWHAISAFGFIWPLGAAKKSKSTAKGKPNYKAINLRNNNIWTKTDLLETDGDLIHIGMS